MTPVHDVAQQLCNSSDVANTCSLPSPAYAYAYASACTRKEPLPRLEQRLDRIDWDYLLQERIGIMHEAGLSMARALALGLADTQKNHGPRPAGGEQ